MLARTPGARSMATVEGRALMASWADASRERRPSRSSKVFSESMAPVPKET